MIVAAGALQSVGGSASGDEPPCWVARPDLGLYAIAVPLGRSFTAVEVVLDTLVRGVAAQKARPVGAGRATAILASAFARAAALLEEYHLEAPDRRRAGAAVVAVLLGPGYAAVAHLGDCRAHLFRGGVLVRCTTDHLLPDAPSVVVRALGIGPDTEPELQTWSVEPGDVCLLTAEIHSAISDAAITSIVSAAAHTDHELLQELVTLARNSGARDVIAAVIARVEPA